MRKRMIYSLLLTSFILAFAFSTSIAQSVSFQDQTVLRCESGSLDITLDNPSDICAFEVVFVVSTTSGDAMLGSLNVEWDAGLGNLTNRVVDLSGADGVSPDTVRIAAMATADTDACLGSGSLVVAQVSFVSNASCAGEVTLAGATMECNNNSITTQMVSCDPATLVETTVGPGVVTIVNTPPTIADIANQSLPFGQTMIALAVGADGDLANGCEKLSYSISAPATISANGNISWPTTSADICTKTFEVTVTDSCGASASTSFDVCVTNEAPAFSDASDGGSMLWGSTASGSVTAADGDSGPAALLYSVASFNGAGSIIIDPANGDWSWATLEENEYIGTFELCIKVTDASPICGGCNDTNADTVCVEISVVPTMRVTIEKTHRTLQGHHETVAITLDNAIDPGNEMGGFDFLISYDQSALTFVAAEAGQALNDCGWEYFVYRFGQNGNCGPGACPSGMLRVVAIAETNNGANHPTCFVGGSGYSDELVVLDFLVNDDRTLNCSYVPIRFSWYDCGDNVISSVTGDTLMISRHVYDYDNPVSVAGDAPFPTFIGANASCDVNDKVEPIRMIDFQNGGVDIVCSDSIDTRGDINLNGLANEVGDAVVFSNYFVYGLSAFNISLEGQIAASDVNADGLTLSVSDLVYLIRIVIGDANPFNKVVPTTVAANMTHAANGTLTVQSDIAMGAAAIVMEGNVSPILLANNMDMAFNFDGTNTNILVYSLDGNSFTGDVISVNGEMVSFEMATAEGNPVAHKLLPTNFNLEQNYPNPFNPGTTIGFDLPVASEYTLDIYNISGQRVTSFSGSQEAGSVSIEFDASDLASGVYFYKLIAGTFTATKKMVLLK